jgi:membrane-bound metal-dependent hydrolase YbcI (DUF457 family)
VADPLTHLCTALLPMGFVRGGHPALLAVGVSLPDMASRLPSMVLDIVDKKLVPLPDWLIYPWGALHSPIPAATACALIALLFPEDLRRTAFLWLLAGVALHLGFDVLQFHHGEGYQLLFPFSLVKLELGWIGSEATVPVAPWLALLTAAIWAFRGLRDRRSSQTSVTDGQPSAGSTVERR